MADCRGINRKVLSVTDKLDILKMYNGKSDKKKNQSIGFTSIASNFGNQIKLSAVL